MANMISIYYIYYMDDNKLKFIIYILYQSSSISIGSPARPLSLNLELYY